MFQATLIQDSLAFSELAEGFESLLDPHLELSRSVYGQGDKQCLLLYVDNNHTGSQMRIIFDPRGLHAHRQGVHTTLEIDEFELAEKLERAFDDGFDTIWVHA